MILSFKKQFPWGKPTNFEQKIIDWEKIHTIREDKRARWGPHRTIQCATGVRTKKYNCFAVRSCVSIQAIQIHHDKGWDEVKVIINGEKFYQRTGIYVVNDNGMIELAKNDGFDSVEDFFKWFNQDFQGRIIHWTSLRY